MIWKNKELKTLGDMSDAVQAITTKTEALQFMDAYRKLNPEHADENIGYLTGYFNNETRAKMQDLFEVAHPIFGRSSISPEGALAKGFELGNKLKREKM